MRWFVFLFILSFPIFGKVHPRHASAKAHPRASRHKKPVVRVKSKIEKRWEELKFLLRGTEEIRLATIPMLRDLGWVEPIETRDQLKKMFDDGIFVFLPTNKYLWIEGKEIPGHRRITTPGFAKYIEEFSPRLKIKLTYSSAVRSIEDQIEIRDRQKNINAGDISGPRISAHLFGPAIDWTYEGMPLEDCVAFGEFLLKEREKGNVVVALEQRKQHCFHVVYLKDHRSVKTAHKGDGSHMIGLGMDRH